MEPAVVLKRIDEILEDNKDLGKEPSSKRKLAECLGHSHHMTITRWLRIESISAHYSEIALGLGISVNRLLQNDTYNDLKELELLLESRTSPKKGLDLAKRIANLAIGATERHYSYKNLGRALSHMSMQEESLREYERARSYVVKSNIDEEEHADLLLRIAMEYFLINDFVKYGELLVAAEGLSDSASLKGRVLQYVVMACTNQCKNLVQAKKHNQMALDLFEESNDKIRIAKAYHNFAHIAFLEKRYDDCIHYHTSSRIFLRHFDLHAQLRSDLDFAKFLFCAGRVKEAKEIIESHIEQDHIYDLEMKAKYHMLSAEIEQNAEILEPIVDQVAKLPKWLQLYFSDIYMRYSQQDNFYNFAYNLLRESSPIAQKPFYEEEQF